MTHTCRDAEGGSRERERERHVRRVFRYRFVVGHEYISLSLYIHIQAAYYCARMTGTGKTQNAGRKNEDAQRQKYTYHHIIIPRISNLATERQRVRTYITHVLYVREGWRRVNNMPRHPRSQFHVDVSLSLPLSLTTTALFSRDKRQRFLSAIRWELPRAKSRWEHVCVCQCM